MVVEKLEGSKELKQSLPYGAITKIAKIFKHSDAWCNHVITGKQKGNSLIIECAEKIADLHQLEIEKQEIILKSYINGINS
jgi:hypothetical protein